MLLNIIWQPGWGVAVGGEWIHIAWLSPFAGHLKLSQHYLLISYTAMQNKKFLKY